MPSLLDDWKTKMRETARGNLQIGQVTDGTAVIGHSGLDHEYWLAAKGVSEELKNEVAALAGEFPTSEALVRDVFWASKKMSMVDPPVALRPSHTLHASMLEGWMATTEYNILRRSINGDQFGAIMAAREITPALLAALTDEDKQALVEASEHDQLASALDMLISEFEARGEHALSEMQLEQLKSLRAQRAHVQGMLDVDGQRALSEASIEAARQQARAATQAAQQQVSSMQAACEAFGPGPGGLGADSGSGIPFAQKMQLARTFAKNEKLRLIADLCGRLKLSARNIQRARVDQDPNEVTGVERGDDLARLLPGELVLLADPDTEDLFYKRYSDHDLLLRKIEPFNKQEKGPIVVAIDESGSMGGTPDIWAKAVTLTLMSIARLQKRDFAVIHFGYGRELKTRVFPGGQASTVETIKVASHFFDSNGTDYNGWVKAALTLVEDSRFDKADVILISDGAAGINDEILSDWKRVRKERHMRGFGVLIGTEDSYGLLSQMVDAVLTIDMHETSGAEELLFSL